VQRRRAMEAAKTKRSPHVEFMLAVFCSDTSSLQLVISRHSTSTTFVLFFGRRETPLLSVEFGTAAFSAPQTCRGCLVFSNSMSRSVISFSHYAFHIVDDFDLAALEQKPIAKVPLCFQHGTTNMLANPVCFGTSVGSRCGV